MNKNSFVTFFFFLKECDIYFFSVVLHSIFSVLHELAGKLNWAGPLSKLLCVCCFLLENKFKKQTNLNKAKTCTVTRRAHEVQWVFGNYS